MTAGLTVYALTTKTDFTMQGAAIFILFIGLICIGMVAWITGLPWLR